MVDPIESEFKKRRGGKKIHAYIPTKQFYLLPKRRRRRKRENMNISLGIHDKNKLRFSRANFTTFNEMRWMRRILAVRRWCFILSLKYHEREKWKWL